ncbi:MAG: ABC transporter permease [Planctomycetaceae bacterium]|nr:ABC transporter permease [Planctomycetaceae bacterium]
MAVGPIFEREVLTAPRRLSHYMMRSGFVAALLILFYSIRQATIGFQDVLFASDVASFSALTFRVFALLQLTLSLFFATLFSASLVAQEKDRKTLILLLMTDLRNYELATGKLLASLLNVGVLLAVSWPVFCFLKLLGGVTWSQILWSQAIVLSATLAAGSWGCLVAFWREKTFQTLAISVLGVVLFVLVAEATGSALGGSFSAVSPYSGLFKVLSPLNADVPGVIHVSAWPCVLTLLAIAGFLSFWTVFRLRVWNPSKDVFVSVAEEKPAGDAEEKESKPVSGRQHRKVWNQAVIWREMRTRAYGRRMIWIKLAYVALALIIAAGSILRSSAGDQAGLVLGMVSAPAFSLLGVGILSLLLCNAQAVTSITNERDGRTLEILLVTDLRPWEFILGKIGGALWNAREMILLPLALIILMLSTGRIPGLTVENAIYLATTYLVLSIFAVTLGLHAGLSYENSRQAIAHSLGTMFFLCIGIFVFMLLLVEARSSFAIQLQSFILFIGFGSLGLYSSLTYRNPSNALTLASLVLPFLTFYAITEFLLGGNLGVSFWICLAYGFTSVAMMVPAMNDFDIALGRNAQEAG